MTPPSQWRGGVALRKESVDRNPEGSFERKGHFESLSARSAWIEIEKCAGKGNFFQKSLSARRAWIEIVLIWE